MSLNEGRVCASCATFSAATISCTKCLTICCSGCFSDLVGAMVTANVDVAQLTARICRKCIEGPRRPNAARRSAGAAGGNGAKNVTTECARNDQGLCRAHGKVLKLYCVNCAVAICADCLDHGQPHSLHQVNNLATVYLDRASSVGAKLAQAEKVNDELRAGTEAYKRNLEQLEKEEEAALKEIQAIADRSKLEVTRVTTVRKEFLREKLRDPTVNGVVLKELRDKAQQLSPYELLEQLPEFETKCDGLIAQKRDITLQKVDDIHCDLIPQCIFKQIVFCGFQNGNTGSTCVFEEQFAHDTEWIFTVRKADMLQVELKAKDAKVQAFRHMLVVVIQHPKDITKMVNLSIDLNGRKKVIDVVRTAYLVEQGFCDTEGNLTIRIGIRCLNALTERRVLKHQYKLLNQQLPAVTRAYDYGYRVMHFYPKLTDITHSQTMTSSHIKYIQKGSWYLKVFLQSNIVNLVVAQLKTATVYCNIFIEVVHSNPKKSILIRGQQYSGLSTFVKLNTLTTDDGFHPDGNLHIRFGVKPVAISTSTAPQPTAVKV